VRAKYPPSHAPAPGGSSISNSSSSPDLLETGDADTLKCMWTLIGDNLDLMSKVKLMSVDKRNQMYHWFHIIASRSRVSSRHLDDFYALGDMNTDWHFDRLIPAAPDFVFMKRVFRDILGGILVRRLDFLSSGDFCCKSFITEGTSHPYRTEMKRPSKEVFLMHKRIETRSFRIHSLACGIGMFVCVELVFCQFCYSLSYSLYWLDFSWLACSIRSPANERNSDVDI
jgi:hypothetical protein